MLGTAAVGVVAALSQTPAACLARTAQQPSRRTAGGRTISVRQFGARGDGRSDDRASIQEAINSVARSGGGTVFFPAGTYMVSRAGESAVALGLKSGVTLEGEGKATIIRLQAGSGGHVVNVVRETDCAIRNMVVDGNRNAQTSTGHAIRSGGVTRFRLENLLVMNAFHYGIGLEGETSREVTIENVVIQDCGGDGIDIKNRNSANFSVSIANVTILRWGLRSDKETQAAIDCRGQVRLSNIRISQPGADDSVGIRMRQGELRDSNGLGAHGSVLDGFDIRMGSGRRQIGITVVARQVAISGGSVTGGFRGLIVQAAGFSGSSIAVSKCSDSGILVDSGTARFSGDKALLSNCSITGCGGSGIEIEADDARIVGCKISGNGRHGLLVKDTASRTRVIGGDFSGNRAGPILNRGAGARIAALAS